MTKLVLGFLLRPLAPFPPFVNPWGLSLFPLLGPPLPSLFWGGSTLAFPNWGVLIGFRGCTQSVLLLDYEHLEGRVQV